MAVRAALVPRARAGLLGYALTFYRLKGGRPEHYECELLSRAMRLLALGLLYGSSHSLRVCLALLLGVVAVHAAPRGPTQAAMRLVRRVTERGPATAPTTYVTESGTTARWRPATESGRFLSEDQYQEQSRSATDDALRRHFASPEYQAWLLNNHGRFKVDDGADDGVGKTLSFDDDDDD